MFFFIKNKFNFQIFISYLGIFPFIFVLLDDLIFKFFFINLLKDFIFIYTLIIITFIGAIRWKINNKLNIYEMLFILAPSLISTFLIITYLLKFNINFLFLLIMIFLVMQLLADFIFYKLNSFEKFFFIMFAYLSH